MEESEIFGEYILDFKYILFDVKRYDEDKLLEMANVIGSAFFVDQKPDSVELVERLKKLALHLENMSEEDFGILRTWIKHIIMRGIPEEKVME